MYEFAAFIGYLVLGLALGLVGLVVIAAAWWNASRKRSVRIMEAEHHGGLADPAFSRDMTVEAEIGLELLIEERRHPLPPKQRAEKRRTA